MDTIDALTRIADYLDLLPIILTSRIELDPHFGANADGWPAMSVTTNEGRVIYSIVRALRPKNVLEFGTCGGCSATRDFLYVDDCVEGIMLATEKYDKGDPVNLGSGAEIDMRDLSTQIAYAIGYKGFIKWDASHPNGQPRRCLSTNTAEREFWFIAKTGLSDGLRETIRWYEENRHD